MSPYLYVAIGGAIGACLRYFLVIESTKLLGKGFPFGTLLVNVIGSFLLGCLYAWLNNFDVLSNNLRLLLGVGLLGALTTFSTFSFDTFMLLQSGFILKAALNILINVSVCIFAVWLAFLLVKG
ncbi:fluoride efflux transporter CrcB [Glaciecola sp. 2405UD65-10]|jgi:CrcB protein|uniref:fluoride efflux transporter CrcB n=1 Tax=Glaciecola sp. 2405UD65-10 TaxID=3397244 RepID=UPI003B5CA41C